MEKSQGRGMIFDNGADPERDGMIQYIKGKSSHPRYRWLPTQFYEDSLVRWANGSDYAAVDVPDETLKKFAPYQVSYWPYRPNLTFQILLQNLNDDRLLHKVRQMGLTQNSLASPAWEELSNLLTTPPDPRAKPRTLDEVAEKISSLLPQFHWNGKIPRSAFVKERLRSYLTAEIEDQIERVYRQQIMAGRAGLKYLPYSSDKGDDPLRIGVGWMGAPTPFYQKLLNLKEVTEAHRIAFHIETDDIVGLAVISLLLDDRGITLTDWTMNLRQMSPSFHDGGLQRTSAFLFTDGTKR